MKSMCSCERVRRRRRRSATLSSSEDCFTKREKKLDFHPHCMPASGAMGPSRMTFLKEVYGRAKNTDKFLMSQKCALKHTGLGVSCIFACDSETA